MVGLLSIVWVLWPVVVGFDMGLDLLWIVVSGGFQWWWALIWGWIFCSGKGEGGCGFCYGGSFAMVGLAMVVVLLWWWV